MYKDYYGVIDYICELLILVYTRAMTFSLAFDASCLRMDSGGPGKLVPLIWRATYVANCSRIVAVLSTLVMSFFRVSLLLSAATYSVKELPAPPSDMW